MENDDLSIPEFLRRKPGEKRPEWTPPPVNPRSLLVNPSPKKAEKKEKEKKPTDFVPDVQAAIREKTAYIIGEIEGMIDDGVLTTQFDMYRYLIKREHTPMVASKIVGHFTPRLQEIEAVLNKEDTQLTEAYSAYSKDEIQGIQELFTKIIDDSKRYASNTKALRSLQRKKLPSIEKLTKNLPFAKTSPKYKLVSIDPTKIIGAQELWTFNESQNILTVFRALDRKGLTLKGSTVMNINEAESQSKRIGRHTEERLKTVLEGGKVQIRKLMEGISSSPIPLTRITKQTILLRVLS